MSALLECINRYYPISTAAQEALNTVLKRVELPKNSFLISEGNTCSHLYFLEKGCLRGYYNHDGKEVTYWFGFENSFATSFYSFISRKPAFETIQLLEDSVLWVIRYEELHHLYDQYPDIERLGRIINERYYVMLEERFVSTHFKTATERYENLMETSPHIIQRISLGYIAAYLGISQETLSRIRGKV